MGLCLSTSWNAFRHTQAKNLLFEIKKLGFEEVELSFNLTSTMVSEIEEWVKNSRIKVISLHNFCPIPEGLAREIALPDYFPISSPDEAIRAQAIKQTKLTIDTARKLNAKAVVLHSGRVEIPDLTRELIKLQQKGLRNSPAFTKLKGQAIKQRQAHSQIHFEQAIKSLEEISRFSQGKNIALGIENRIYHREIPSFEEISVILKRFQGTNIFYWHDTGHAQIMENLGFARQRQYLESYSQEMLGIHLHDCRQGKDHLAPSQGEVDFSGIKPFLKKQTLKVIEAHHPATGQDIMESKKYLEGLFNGKL